MGEVKFIPQREGPHTNRVGCRTGLRIILAMIIKGRITIALPGFKLCFSRRYTVFFLSEVLQVDIRDTPQYTHNKKFWEEQSPTLLSLRTEYLMRRGPHRKHCVQQFFYCCVCIRYRGNVFTEPLLRNDTGATQTAS
jgi:hypothetical protein